jgi:hypothetical protein
MTGIQIAAGDDWAYGPDLVDRFKARAFAQDPGSQTPCCGFEEGRSFEHPLVATVSARHS